ncbi:MAG: hypothetical protein WC703_03795 [Candidatus Neomarinimicrobiota bacterium]
MKTNLKTFAFIAAHVAARMTAIHAFIFVATRIGFITVIGMKIVSERNGRFPDGKWSVFRFSRC